MNRFLMDSVSQMHLKIRRKVHFMKKLLVLALSAVLVFGMAAIATAAPQINFKGEIDGVADTTHSTATAGGQVTLNSAVNDNVTFESEFTWGGFNKGYGAAGLAPDTDGQVTNEMAVLDHYFANVKTAYGSLKAGWVDNWTGQKLDQIATNIYDQGKRHGGNFIYTTPAFGKVSASLGYEPQTEDYAVLVDYNADKYGVEFAYSKPGDENQDASYGLNGYYNIMDGATVYGQYAIKSATPDGDGLLSVGAKYNTGKGFWGEAEYGQMINDDKDTMIEAGYYIQPNATLFVRNRNTAGESTNYAIMAVNF
jgi:hypothetical protein